jgi:hypothetical protein
MKKIFLVFIFLIISCSNKEQSKLLNTENKKINTCVIDKEFNEFKKSNYFDSDRVMKLKYKVLKNGDKFAYSNLVLFYSYNKTKEFELLPYSLIMVEKHKKYNYCSNVFENLLTFYTGKELGDYYNGEEASLINYLKNLDSLNEQQRDYSIYFLKLGANNNDITSTKYLRIINKNTIVPDF